MVQFEKISPPNGDRVTISNGVLDVPNNPIITYMNGDGIGPDIMDAVRPTVDAAVHKAFNGEKKISWFKTYAGDEARAFYHP